jgi:predicted NAD-dependent protein-ADP-ribosyltransferase YbiA (DUF1768 family)
MVKTKAWNTDAACIPANEEVYTDYEDEERTVPCSAKFKTGNLDGWIKAHEDFYKEEPGVEWDDKSTFKQLRIKPGKQQRLIVKFYRGTNVVMAQSKELSTWGDYDVRAMKEKMSETAKVIHPQSTDISHTVTVTSSDVKGIQPLDQSDSEEDLHDAVIAPSSAEVLTNTQQPPEPARPDAEDTDPQPNEHNHTKSEATTSTSDVKGQNMTGASESPSTEVSHILTRMQVLEDTLVRAVDGFRNDFKEARIEAINQELILVKEDRNRWKKECEKLREAAKKVTKVTSATGENVNTDATCEQCATLQEQLAATIVMNEDLEASLKSEVAKLADSKRCRGDLETRNQKLYDQHVSASQEAEELREKLQVTQTELCEEKEKHVEWCAQMQKQLESRITLTCDSNQEKWSSVSSKKPNHYLTALLSNSTLQDHEKMSRCKPVYHVNDTLCVQGRDDPLSNFYPLENPICEDGIDFKALENLYQYKMCSHHGKDSVAQVVARMIDPGEAKTYAGRYIPKQDDKWIEQKEAVMMDLLERKYDCCTQFKEKLTQSHRKSLLHTVKDTFWE